MSPNKEDCKIRLITDVIRFQKLVNITKVEIDD